MKKLFVILLMAALAINLAACGGKENSDGGQASGGTKGEASPGKKVNLTFQTLWADETSVQLRTLRKLIEEYTADHPNVSIEVDALNSSQQVLKLKTQAASNEMPDITVINPGAQMKPFVDGNKLAPLDDILAKDGLRETYLQGVLDYYTFDGKTYGLAEASDIAFVLYNKELFAQAGVEVPTTFEEMVEAAKKLRAKGITPMTIGEKEPWTGSFMFMNILLRLAGPDFLNDVNAKKRKFTDPEFVRAIEKLQDFIKAGGFVEGATSFDYAQSENLFLTGKAAMNFSASWSVSSLEESEIQDQVGVFLFPTVDGKGNLNEFMLAPGAGYAIAANTQHMEEAKDFLLFYTKNFPKKMFEIKGAVGLAQHVEGDLKEAGYSQMAQDVLELFKKVEGGTIAFDNTMDPNTTQTHLNGTQMLFVSDIKAEDLAKEHQNAFEANNP